MRVAHTEALILLLLYPFGIVAWDPRVECVSGGHGNPADLFPRLTREAGVTASLPWLHPYSVKTQPFGIPNKNLSALNSASEAWLEQKGVHISKSAQLSPYLEMPHFLWGRNEDWISWLQSWTFKAPNLGAVLVPLASLSLGFESGFYFSALLQRCFLNLPSLCSSGDRTAAMLLLAYCNSRAVQPTINKSLLYNINKLSALLGVTCCHQSKSCVSKALICESLVS